MKVKIERGLFWGRSCIRATATIAKSKKIGIPTAVQKTWKVYPELDTSIESVRPLFMAEATRWRDGVMKKIFGDQEPPAELMQIEAL